jgi:biotin-dependent carboxylase-like uncharacterized protein
MTPQMSVVPVLVVASPGAGASIQDLGRIGWKRYGIPSGGAMDADSARKANLLVGNQEGAPVLELLFTGARFRVLSTAEFSITGADVESTWPRWRSFSSESGQEIAFGELRAGVWSYLAVHGGFAESRWFGSASVDPRAGLGDMLRAGVQLRRQSIKRASGISARFVPDRIRESFEQVPVLGIWRGPEWECLPEQARDCFLGETWIVSTESDRSGYRLRGTALKFEGVRMPSAPLTVGTIQVPPDGFPIVLLRDGPTVGGYPRLAVVDPLDVSRFTQCAPGTPLRFQLIE